MRYEACATHGLDVLVHSGGGYAADCPTCIIGALRTKLAKAEAENKELLAACEAVVHQLQTRVSVGEALHMESLRAARKAIAKAGPKP